jgi:hypothetical protein
MLIVESLTDHKRQPIHGAEKVISLGDIAMYTDNEEVPLSSVFAAVQKKENGAAVDIDLKKVTTEQLHDFFAEVLPTYDRDRVHGSDIKKLISWYNMLLASGITDFEEKAEAANEEQPAAEEQAASAEA